MSDARWLDAAGVAAYFGIKRPDYVLRYVKAGKIPKPGFPLGPHQRRWDRDELDRWSGRGVASGHHATIQSAADEIARSSRRADRQKAPR